MQLTNYATQVKPADARDGCLKILFCILGV